MYGAPGYEPGGRAALHGAPLAQAAASAALLLPTVPLYFVAYGIDAAWWLTWAASLTTYLTLAVAVLIRGRSWPRRVFSGGLAVVGIVAASGGELVNAQFLPEYSQSLFRVSYGVAWLMFVAAWGAARRRSRASALGLIPTAVLIAIALWLYQSGSGLGWLVIWMVDFGVFVGGCLACWAADVLVGTRAPRQVH